MATQEEPEDAEASSSSGTDNVTKNIAFPPDLERAIEEEFSGTNFAEKARQAMSQGVIHQRQQKAKYGGD